MNEQQDIPRMDGLRPDDPPFRENFSTQPDKRPDQLQAQRQAHNAQVAAQRKARPMPILEPSINNEQAETVMQDTADIIAIIRRVADGGKFVHVEKLIEALK